MSTRYEMTINCYRDRIYPYLVDAWGDPPPIQKIRQKIIPLAEGTVLEIGAGSGANFPYYDPTIVNKLYAIEPNPGMVRLAKQNLPQKLSIEFIDLPGQCILVEDETMDAVISTCTLCTMPDLTVAMKGIVRVMKPDGKLLFFEVGLSPDPAVQC